MTSYNSVKRIKYTNKATDEYVSLDEYILFESDNKDDKYIVFKFRNNIEQYLYEVGFVIYQYTEKDELVEKSSIEYKNFRAGNYETFVPDQKYKANKLCAYISVELKYALFEKLIYKDGVTKPIIYNFTDYLNDVKALEMREGYGVKLPADFNLKEKTENEPKNVVLSKTQKKELSKLKRKKIYLQDITKQNKTNAMPIFNIIFSTVLIIFIAFIAMSFKDKTTIVRIDGVRYYLDVWYDTATLQKVETDNDTFVIPDSIEGYKLKSIKSGAFQDSKIRILEIDADNIDIQSGAFRNCTNLEIVSINGSARIRTYAFVGCDNIKEIYCPNSQVNMNAFGKPINLIFIQISSTNAPILAKIFDRGYKTNEELPQTFEIIISYSFLEEAKETFFEGFEGKVTTY